MDGRISEGSAKPWKYKRRKVLREDPTQKQVHVSGGSRRNQPLFLSSGVHLERAQRESRKEGCWKDHHHLQAPVFHSPQKGPLLSLVLLFKLKTLQCHISTVGLMKTTSQLVVSCDPRARSPPVPSGKMCEKPVGQMERTRSKSTCPPQGPCLGRLFPATATEHKGKG